MLFQDVLRLFPRLLFLLLSPSFSFFLLLSSSFFFFLLLSSSFFFFLLLSSSFFFFLFFFCNYYDYDLQFSLFILLIYYQNLSYPTPYTFVNELHYGDLFFRQSFLYLFLYLFLFLFCFSFPSLSSFQPSSKVLFLSLLSEVVFWLSICLIFYVLEDRRTK